MARKGDVYESIDLKIIGFEILSILRLGPKSPMVTFLNCALYITMKKQRKKSLKESILSPEDWKGDYWWGGGECYYVIKRHKITECCKRRTNSSFVFWLSLVALSCWGFMF